MVTGSDQGAVQKVIDAMRKEFALRELGDLSYFLGIQVKRSEEALHMSQQKYLVNLLKSCKWDNLRPSSTPMLAQQDLVSEEEIPESSEYRRILGSFQYLTLTQPGIQYEGNKLPHPSSCVLVKTYIG